MRRNVRHIPKNQMPTEPILLGAPGLEPSGEEPFLKLGVVKAGTAVVVYFVDFTIGGFHAVIVAVVPLLPALAAGRACPEAVVRPGFHYFHNSVVTVVKPKGHGDFNIAAGGDLYLPTEIAFRHGIT